MLIVLEGIDGTGKTTLAADLAGRLRACGLPVLETREPGDSEAGRKLRQLLSQNERTSTPEEELELFHADRRDHVHRVVLPALKKGTWVVQDRTFYSTAAYQGALGMDVEDILATSREFAPEPDLTVLLQLSPEQALQRIQRERGSFSSFERIESLRKVHAIYVDLARSNPGLVEIDAQRPLEEVKAEVARVCFQRLGQPDPPAS